MDLCDLEQLDHCSHLSWPFIQSEKYKEIKGISGIPGCYFVLIQEIEFQLWKSNGELCGEAVKRHNQLGIVT